VSWHYQIRQRTDKGETGYDIVERYGGLNGWTRDGIRPYGCTASELIADLQRMIHDAITHPILVEKEPE
jgi:predicted lipoprotein with Yx(FWY)xxD motif